MLPLHNKPHLELSKNEDIGGSWIQPTMTKYIARLLESFVITNIQKTTMLTFATRMRITMLKMVRNEKLRNDILTFERLMELGSSHIVEIV